MAASELGGFWVWRFGASGRGFRVHSLVRGLRLDTSFLAMGFDRYFVDGC